MAVEAAAAGPKAGPGVLRDVREDDLDVFFEQQREPEAVAMAIFPAIVQCAFISVDTNHSFTYPRISAGSPAIRLEPL